MGKLLGEAWVEVLPDTKDFRYRLVNALGQVTEGHRKAEDEDVDG